jgi:hypothetical protein
MLPWLFAVLLALNLALVWWGQHHEVPIEPQLRPIAEAPLQIELLGTGPALAAAPSPARVPAEAPAPVAHDRAQPVNSAPLDSAVTQPELVPPAPDQGAPAPDGDVPPELSPVIEPLSDMTPNEPGPESTEVDLPDPVPLDEPSPLPPTGAEAAPGLDTAVPAAAAATAAVARPKAVKKRKNKPRARKPPPAEPVELPLPFQ